MPFSSGPLNLVGINPQLTSNIVTTSVSSGVVQSANQLFRGVGNQSLAQAGTAVLGNVVNVGINSILGTKVAGSSGLSLTTGANVLASTITPFVTSGLAQGLNQSIQNSLRSAGPLGSVLSQIGTGLVSQGINGLTNLITGAATPGSGAGGSQASKFFPGAGDEPDANYNGGNSYTLGSNGPDVVIVIRPANAGPLASAAAEAINSPAVSTSMPLDQNLDPVVGRDPALGPLKREAIEGALPNSFRIDVLPYTANNPSALAGGVTSEVSGAAASDATWTFICAPEEISWTTSNAVNRVDIFGTNNPPAISGTKGLREFNMNNALVEGFTRNKKVEAKVAALEDLLKYKSSLAGGFVNVPVYQVWAEQKGYGQRAYFLIKSVQVKETMRDLSGDTTRATVDISFVEVPAYQVDSGIDQAPFGQQGSNSNLSKISLINAQRNLVATQAQAKANVKPPPRTTR
jgi:hypothetical protein